MASAFPPKAPGHNVLSGIALLRRHFEATMAGVFGDRINSRADFQRELGDAKALTEQVLQRLPHERLLQSVLRQLEALQTWTINNQAPTPEDRKRITMGIQMYREYETTDDDELYALRRRIGSLNNYVKYWPQDDVAADPNNLAYL